MNENIIQMYLFTKITVTIILLIGVLIKIRFLI